MSRTDRGGNGTAGAGTSLVNSVDQMMKLPLQMTGATWDFMMQGMRNVTGTGQQPRTSESNSMMSPEQSGMRSSDQGQSQSQNQSQGQSQSQSWESLNPQGLGGDDLKYVTWSLIFTKPGFECVLEPQHSELVNYSADVSSFAAVKIAKFLEKARHGHVDKAESWRDHNYPPEHSRTESSVESSGSMSTSSVSSSSSSSDRGWRIPADDQKYIMFLHRVEWRLPRQEEVTRVERVTIERGTTRIA